MDIFSVFDNYFFDRFDRSETTTMTLERNGLFDVSVHKILMESDLQPETIFESIGEILSQRESIAREMRVRKMKRPNLETLTIIACVCLFDIQNRVLDKPNTI